MLCGLSAVKEAPVGVVCWLIFSWYFADSMYSIGRATGGSARPHQSPITACDVIDIGHRRITAVLRLLAFKLGKTLDFSLGKLALGVERRHLGTFRANLGGQLSRCWAIEIGVNEPG